MDYFAFRLSHLMDRPVVDLTNLRGGYDFDLEYTVELPVGFPEGGKINGEEPDTSGERNVRRRTLAPLVRVWQSAAWIV